MASTTIDAAGSGTRALRRVLHHYVRRSRQCLAVSAPSDEAVHEARKAIKRARTALRLLRPALPQAPFRATNRALRDTARALNALRDARVLILALQGLRRAQPALRRNAAAAELAARLQKELAQARARLDARALRAACRALQRVERRARGLPVGRRGWSVLGPAVRRLYRKGRRVLPTASGHPSDASLHEWRKQIKYLRYALRMLRPMQPGLLRDLEKQAEAIAEQLGEAHDLALLRARAQASAAHGRPGQRHLVQLIEQLRTQRAFAALVAGERLFQPRPRELEQALGRAWRRWQRQE